MSEKHDKEIETFRAYIVRKCLTRTKEPSESWNSRNRGEGIPSWSGKNRQKREQRAARKVDRLAHIRRFRDDSDRHVPKLKHVPREIFE